jgi:hypothetical protein
VSPGQTAPRTQAFGLRARAWWVMRETPRFTLPSLLAIVADGDEADAASNLGKYLRALSRAGILAETGRDQPASLTDNGVKRYRLARNSGPKAPVWRASRREVYDPNTGAVYPLAEAGHE